MKGYWILFWVAIVAAGCLGAAVESSFNEIHHKDIAECRVVKEYLEKRIQLLEKERGTECPRYMYSPDSSGGE